MERFSIREFLVDPGSNVVLTPDGTEIRLEPKIMDVLCVLAGQPGEVISRSVLMDRVWGFEHGADDGPTRAISVLRKVFGDSNRDPRFFQTVPKRGYRLIAPVCTAENDPDGPDEALAVRSGDRPAASAPAQDTYGTAGARPGGDLLETFLPSVNQLTARLRKPDGPWLAALAGTVLTAIIILGIALIPAGTGTPPAVTGRITAGSERTVAVLPFTNRSIEEKDAFLADGFHEALLTQLSKISGFRVISRTSVMQYRETEKSTPQIAGELGAAVLLEGSVQRSGQRIRINVQLIDGATDTHKWAEIYDVDLTPENLFAVQSDITEVIAGTLEAVLTERDKIELAEIPTRNPAAYEAYLRGKITGDLSQFYDTKWRQATKEFNEAIRLDPGFAAAYAGKAKAYLMLYWYGGRHPEFRQLADESLRSAEMLDPEAVSVLIARAFYYYWGFLDYARADALFRRAVQKTPSNAEVWMGMGAVARRAGRFDDAITAFEQGRRLDPRNLSIVTNLAITHAMFGRFAEAEALVTQAKLIDAANQETRRVAAHVAYFMGRPQQAWEEFSAPLTNASPLFLDFRAFSAWLSRDPENLETVLAEWPEGLRRPAWQPEIYAIWKAVLLDMQKRIEQSQALFSQIKNRLSAGTDLIGRDKFRGPTDFPLWMLDLKELRGAFKNYRTGEQDDAWAHLFSIEEFARAFARTGDPETALDLVEDLMRRAMPSAFLRFSAAPSFDALRDHPRYLALEAEYEKWARENGYE